MPPSKILILRHAEKPGAPGEDQPSDGCDLSTRGFARAAALAYILPDRFGPSDFLVAAAESKHSNRPIETITPLAQRLSLPIESNHPDGDYQGLADALLSHDKYAGRTVVVCWHHGKIPDLAAAMGVSDPPQPWPAVAFDRVWAITFSGGNVVLSNLPQCVLFGDSEA
jgi:hypothetical protein